MDYSYWIDFFLFGLGVNLGSAVILFFYTVYKAVNISEEEYEEYKRFSDLRYKHISQNNSSLKLLLSNALVFLPGYVLTYLLIFIYHSSAYDGVRGLFAGIMATDRFAFIQTVKFRKQSE